MTGYLLDTNVVSELIKPSPDALVAAWIRATEETDLHLSVLTFAEIRYGIEKLPQGAVANGCAAGWTRISPTVSRAASWASTAPSANCGVSSWRAASPYPFGS